MAVECISEIKLSPAKFTVVNKGVGEVFGLDVILDIVLGLVREVRAKRAHPGVGPCRLAPMDKLVEVDRSLGRLA